MFSESSKWELGFVLYIAKVTISRFIILRFGVDSKLAYFTRTYVRGFVATRPFCSDIYVYHYVYICGVQPSADTSFSVLMEYRR